MSGNSLPPPHEVSRLLDEALHDVMLSESSSKSRIGVRVLRVAGLVFLVLAAACTAGSLVAPALRTPPAMLAAVVCSVALLLFGGWLQAWAGDIERSGHRPSDPVIARGLQGLDCVPQQAKISIERYSGYTMLLLSVHSALFAFAPWPGTRMVVPFCVLSAGLVAVGIWLLRRVRAQDRLVATMAPAARARRLARSGARAWRIW